MLPGLLEIAAYTLFFPTAFVGPLFSFNRFRKFIAGDFHRREPDEPPVVSRESLFCGIVQFLGGIGVTILHLIGVWIVPNDYFTSKAFFDDPFLTKVFWSVIWFRATMYRYIAAWKLAEGAATLCETTYNGLSAGGGHTMWDGIDNADFFKFEAATDFDGVIHSFNKKTNEFAKMHIFRRLKYFSSNKTVNQCLTLFYMAIWHGLRLGYYFTFFIEFLCLNAQNQFRNLVRTNRVLHSLLNLRPVKMFSWITRRAIIDASMAFAFLSFGLLETEVWVRALGAMYWYGLVFYLGIWPIVYLCVQLYL